MSSKPYTLKIEGEEKRCQGIINIDWDVYTIGMFDAVLVEAEKLEGFDLVTIDRGEVEIFGGRIEKPELLYSVEGRCMPITGFDHTVRLSDYKTPIQSIAGTSTVTVLGSILAETPFSTSMSGTFEYITALTDWDTWVELVTGIEVFSDVTVELDLDVTELEDEVNAGTWTGCNPGLKSCFFYDGTTQRFYVWAKDAANNLYYYHSTDGDTWTGVDTGYNPTGDAWSVAWYADKVYLFVYDGINTDFYRGTIADATGTITFGVSTGNIFANEIRFGPVFDSQDDIWVIRNNANGQAYESTDDGATWNYRFGPGGTELWGLADMNNDGDMMGIVLDVPNTDLEEWLWDRNAGTFAFVAQMDNEDDVDGLDVCQDADYNVYAASWDDTNDEIVVYCNSTGSWNDDTINVAGVANFSIGSEGKYAYLIIVDNTGTIVYKYYDDDEQQSWSSTDYGTPFYCSVPRGYLQDGQIATFFTLIDTDNDLWFIAFTQIGLRLVEAATTGYIRTETVTASGAFTSWGICSATGNTDLDETLWNILKSATDAELIDDQLPNFDMNLAGVPTSETSIKVYIEFDGATGDPIVYEFSVTERTDTVEMSTDGEDCYTAVQRLANLAGAEFWVERNDDGTYTVYFSTRRGEDKSGYIILRCSTTGDEVDTKANVKVLRKTFDYTDYANAILFIGGLDSDGNRVEVEVRDTSEITARDQEYWYTLRDAEVTTTAMGRTLAVLELNNRNTPTLRLSGEFLDKWSSNDISIGDSVTLIGEWPDAELKVEGSHRVVALRRSWGVGGGERVVAEFSNKLKPVQYYNYVKKISDLERVSTS